MEAAFLDQCPRLEEGRSHIIQEPGWF
jgi:hypothetical protein